MSNPNPDPGAPQAPPQAPAQAPYQAPHYPPPPPASYSELESRRKSPLVAGILSLAPGLGQIYLGYYQRGFTHFFIVAGTIALLASDLPDFGYPLLGLFLPFFWLYNIIDASRRAAAVNQVLAGSGVALPDIELPGQGGSMAGGAALIVIGLILLLHTQFDISLRWLETWWPLAPVILGVYLFTKGLRERSGAA